MIDEKILDEVLPAPGLEELKDGTVAQLKKEGFVVTNFHPGGIFYTLLMIILRVRVELTGLLRSVLNNMFVSHATGPWLDLKMADYSKKRKARQKTQGYVTLSRTDSLEDVVRIPKGHVFKTEKDINSEELRYFSIEESSLQAGVLSVDVLVEAEQEGSRYNVPQGQITRSLTYIGEVDISNGTEWIVREGSDAEDDESGRARTLRSWAELGQRAIEDAFVNTAESIAGVLFAQADCRHPRGQGTVDIIVTGTAGEATEKLLEEVRQAVEQIAGPYDNILVKSSETVREDIDVLVVTGDLQEDEEIVNTIRVILTELLAVRRGRKLNELLRSDINHAIRSKYAAATNVIINAPASDIVLEKDKVVVLGDVSVAVQRG